MDIEVERPNAAFPQPPPPERSEQGRVKSSLRLQSEAQVQVIKQQLGSLEKVRSDLGLSQRKMAQLLLVDPSAWTRWTRPGEEAPPHVWRALQWYLTLREKIPGLTPQYFLGADSRTQDQQVSILERRIRSLEAETNRLRKSLLGALLGMLSIVILAFAMSFGR